MDKAQFKQEVIQFLQIFFQEEQGNRVTSNNMEGLILKIIKLVDDHKPAKGEK